MFAFDNMIACGPTMTTNNLTLPSGSCLITFGSTSWPKNWEIKSVRKCVRVAVAPSILGLIALTWAFPASGQTRTPSTTRTADKAWWLITAASIGSTVADVENTQYVLRHGGQEGNPVFGQHPTRLRMYAITGALTGLSTWVSYRWKKVDDQDKITYGYTAKVRWYAVPLVNVGAHGFGVGFTLGATGR